MHLDQREGLSILACCICTHCISVHTASVAGSICQSFCVHSLACSSCQIAGDSSLPVYSTAGTSQQYNWHQSTVQPCCPRPCSLCPSEHACLTPMAHNQSSGNTCFQAAHAASDTQSSCNSARPFLQPRHTAFLQLSTPLPATQYTPSCNSAHPLLQLSTPPPAAQHTPSCNSAHPFLQLRHPFLWCRQCPAGS